ncbi:MAG: ABC transporter substrate-binding protein [Solirubrobacterales bacterium]
MRRVFLRRAAAAACVLAALSGAGCGKQQQADRTIYLAVPLSGPLAARGADMAHAVTLGLQQTNYDTTGTRLKLKVIDSARRLDIGAAASDQRAVACIGGLSITAVQSIARADSAAGLLQVALAPAPSVATTASARTANVIWQLPSAPGQGDALAQYIAGAGQRQIGFFGDGTAFSGAVRGGFDAGIARAGIEPVALGRIAKGAPVVGAGNTKGFVAADDPANPNDSGPHTTITAGMTEDAYPPAGERFFDAFVKRFGHDPDRFAIYAYEAVGLVLDAIDRTEDAGGAVDRTNVTRSAFSIRNRFGPVGHYDILPSGRTSLYIFQARGGDAPTGPASLIEALR